MKRPQEQSAKYHAEGNAAPWALSQASDEQLEKWGEDPDCIEMETCFNALVERVEKRESDRLKLEAELTSKRQALQHNPFDPRMEVSADARHISGKIVTHLWIIFVLLPFVAAILWAIVK